jgi:lysophospholipase L1-like esterase
MGILDAPRPPRGHAYTPPDNQALMAFRAALANRDASPVNMLFVGDSITEGTGATAMANRWQSRLAEMVRTRFPVPGVVGVPIPHLPGLKTNGVTYPYPIAQAGTPRLGGAGNAVAYGLGRRTDPLTAPSQSDTFTFVGTSFDVFYADATDGGVMSIAIDGGTPALVDTRNAAPIGSGLKWSSPALAPGSHTVVIGYDNTSQANSVANFEGVYLYNGDETKGFRFWDSGHHGYNSASWLSPPLTYQRSFRATKADLVIIELGANDLTNGVTAAQFQTNIADLIATIRTQLAEVQKFPPSIVLMMLWERTTGGASGFTATEPWKNYVDAAQTIADGDDRITVLDLSQRMPSPVAFPDPANQPANLGLYADTVHPSNKGHAMVADEVFRFLFSGP